MPQLFPRWSDTFLRVGFVTVVAGIIAIVTLLLLRANVARAEEDSPPQPMWFDHRHHVNGYRIDCRHCHTDAETAKTAGMPDTRACVACHQAKWLASPYFEPVRRSLEENRPIAWQRAHDLPDHVFFHHGIHSSKGVGCETCHGRVDLMERPRRVAPLTMAWCLDCHRDPAAHLRPREEITTMGWTPDRPQAELGAELAARYGVRSITTCSACHW
jgi:hypothetical protein